MLSLIINKFAKTGKGCQRRHCWYSTLTTTTTTTTSDGDIVFCLYVNRCSELREIAEKKEGHQLAHDVNTFHTECQKIAV